MEAVRQDREQDGEEAGDKQGGRDTRKAGKARDKKENWKERGDKKDAWKERRRRDRVPPEAEPQRTPGNENEDKNPRGNALLSMLKPSPPSATRYSREELLSIGQLPASRVKPPTLSIIIDKENGASPLLVKPKADKASRRRGGDGEEDEGEEEPRRERRERVPRAERGSRSDGEEEPGEARRPGGRRPGDRWKDDDRRPPKGQHEDAGVEQLSAQKQGEGGWGKEPQWDMPDASAAQGDLSTFTLGDIRNAEKSLSGGMSMKDYKASLRAGGASEAIEEAAPKEKEDLFKVEGSGSFFVEEDEDEDVSRASRGFGKWFAHRAEPGPAGATHPAAAQPAATVQQPTGHAPRPATSSQPAEARAPAAAEDAIPVGSNQMGRSILSMLGRADTSSPAPAPGHEDRQGKLSVAELFHLAQGKELPPIPSTAARREELAEPPSSTRAQREALQVAQYMWAAAAKAQPPQPPGRFPGYPATGPCGGSAASAAFAAGRGGGAGGEHLLHEAYTEAMLGHAQWGAAMPVGCPQFGGARGYGPPQQPYNPYSFAPGYPPVPRGPGFDGAGGMAQAAVQRGGGPKAPAEKAPSPLQAAAASPPLPAAGLAAAAPGPGLGGEAADDDAGCSQS